MMHMAYRYRVEEADHRIPHGGAALILVPDAFTLGSQYWDGCLNESDQSHTVDFVLPGETGNFDR